MKAHFRIFAKIAGEKKYWIFYSPQFPTHTDSRIVEEFCPMLCGTQDQNRLGGTFSWSHYTDIFQIFKTQGRLFTQKRLTFPTKFRLFRQNSNFSDNCPTFVDTNVGYFQHKGPPFFLSATKEAEHGEIAFELQLLYIIKILNKNICLIFLQSTCVHVCLFPCHMTGVG
jgi:hypothetical protein